MRFSKIVLALLTSLLLFVASPGQWALTWLMWIALLPLLIACRGLSPRKGFLLGLTCGLIYYVGLIYWIIIALGRYGGLPLWVTVPALLALCLYMAFYLATFTALCSWTSARRLPIIWAAPLAWVGLDLIRCRLFSGFPWLDLGYSQYASPLINQVADLGGHYTITFLIVMINAWLADLYANRRPLRTVPEKRRALDSRFVLPVLLMIIAMGYSLWRYQEVKETISSAPTLAIGLIQGNIDQGEKWQPALQAQTVRSYLALTEQDAKSAPLDLVIWPETAMPFFPDNNPLFELVTNAIATPGSPALLAGAPHFAIDPVSGRRSLFNSAYLISPANAPQGVTLQRYDKEHLVPFGEFVPLQRYLPKALPLVETMGNFSSGLNAAPLISNKARIGVLTCFESIFPELARVRTDLGANILVNLTNDAWYGRSSAPYQQVPMAVLRAIENRRSLARAANTGISCLIDPLGQVLLATPIFEKLEVHGRLPLVEIHSLFTRIGYLFPHLCLLLLSLMLLYGILRRDRV
jgi:apolipoprotein N-acyltransferase